VNSNPTEPELPDDADASVPVAEVRWRPLLKVLAAVRKVIDRTLAGLCIAAFVLLVVVVSWQVFTREVILNSAPWTQEAAQYTFVVLTAVATAYVFSERGHIAVSILVEKFPDHVQRYWAVGLELIVILFMSLAFIWGGFRVSENAWGQSISTLPPLTIGQVYLILPIAGILTVFYSITHIIGILAGAEKPVPVLDETTEV
jgi:TRAP-type C4-dicarboxylate transport system permease small subunit